MQKVNKTQSENRLYDALGIYGRSQIEKLKEYKEKIKDIEKLVIYPDDPNIDKPVEQNQQVCNIQNYYLHKLNYRLNLR